MTAMDKEKADRYDQAVARRLATLRESVDMYKTDIAEKLGMSRQGYQRWEKGEHKFGIGELYALSHALDKSIEWLLDLPTGLSEDEDQLLTAYRRISAPELRKMAIAQVRAVADASPTSEDGGREEPNGRNASD
jgi:transcriptional regulator with XRE-family HTH domain